MRAPRCSSKSMDKSSVVLEKFLDLLTDMWGWCCHCCSYHLLLLTFCHQRFVDFILTSRAARICIAEIRVIKSFVLVEVNV
jgi:hypothetical protein